MPTQPVKTIEVQRLRHVPPAKRLRPLGAKPTPRGHPVSGFSGHSNATHTLRGHYIDGAKFWDPKRMQVETVEDLGRFMEEVLGLKQMLFLPRPVKVVAEPGPSEPGDSAISNAIELWDTWSLPDRNELRMEGLEEGPVEVRGHLSPFGGAVSMVVVEAKNVVDPNLSLDRLFGDAWTNFRPGRR